MDESSPLPAGREPLFVPVSRGSPMPVPAPPRLNNKHDQIMSVHKNLFSVEQEEKLINDKIYILAN